jgi:C1A family cysteine protease
MRNCVFLLLACSVAADSVCTADYPEKWKAFKAKYRKQYKSDCDEKERYQLFEASKERVDKLNKLNGETVFGINWMSDRHESEKHKKGLKKPKDFVPIAPVRDFTKTMRGTSAIDWRYTKAVTPVKNQGQCGCCWAFSATETIESQMILATGNKYDFTLSPQQICSCAPNTGTYACDGCDGGTMEGAYDYVKSAVGLASGDYIPYLQSLTESENTTTCPTEKVEAIDGEDEELSGNYAQVSGYSYATTPCTEGSCTDQDLTKLQAAVETTPVSIAVNAATWSDYTGGILTAAACGGMGADDLDHGVQLVGFNATTSKSYWIVRNSWATTWGEDGYIFLEMNNNTCGLADDATIPDVKLDLNDEEALQAAVRREEMYQLATRASGKQVKQTFV